MIYGLGTMTTTTWKHGTHKRTHSICSEKHGSYTVIKLSKVAFGNKEHTKEHPQQCRCTAIKLSKVSVESKKYIKEHAQSGQKKTW